MSHVVVNCRRTPFGSTLGVAHFLLRLCQALSENHTLTFVVDHPADIDETPAQELIRAMGEVATFTDVRSRRGYRSAIELRPHHFQPQEIADRSIILCHDLHVFDIPAKYGERVQSMQAAFRQNLSSADAVLTEFPRTYFAVERIAEISLPNLFLVDAPLLLDTSGVGSSDPSGPDDPFVLLYPAQLQVHKNHCALIDAVAAVRASGRQVVLRLPGSDFDEAITAEISAHALRGGVADAVEFLGRVSDETLLNHYRDCDGVVVPSLAEGGAYVVLEAIAAGKPVAAHELEAARLHADAVGAQVLWFDAADQEDTTRAIEALVDADPGVSVRANEACRARLASLSWSAVADVVDHVIANLEGRGPRLTLMTDPLSAHIEYRELMPSGCGR